MFQSTSRSTGLTPDLNNLIVSYLNKIMHLIQATLAALPSFNTTHTELPLCSPLDGRSIDRVVSKVYDWEKEVFLGALIASAGNLHATHTATLIAHIVDITKHTLSEPECHP